MLRQNPPISLSRSCPGLHGSQKHMETTLTHIIKNIIEKSRNSFSYSTEPTTSLWIKHLLALTKWSLKFQAIPWISPGKFEDFSGMSQSQSVRVKVCIQSIFIFIRPILLLKFEEYIPGIIPIGNSRVFWDVLLLSDRDRNLTLPMSESTFAQSTRTPKSLKTIQTLSCWYSLDSSHWVLSDEYSFARVSVIFQDFSIILYWQN